MREITLDSDKTMVSYDVTSLFTFLHTFPLKSTVKKGLLQDSVLSSTTSFTQDNTCALLGLCLTATYVQYSKGLTDRSTAVVLAHCCPPHRTS